MSREPSFAHDASSARVPTLASRPLATPQPHAPRVLCSPSARYRTYIGVTEMVRHVYCNVIADEVQDIQKPTATPPPPILMAISLGSEGRSHPKGRSEADQPR